MNKWQVSYKTPTQYYITHVSAWKVEINQENNGIIIDGYKDIDFGDSSSVDYARLVIGLHVYNGLEVLPAKFYTLANKVVSQWSAYLCLMGGEKRRVAHFDTENDARDFAHDLLGRYHSLTRNVIDCCNCEICHNSLKV